MFASQNPFAFGVCDVIPLPSPLSLCACMIGLPAVKGKSPRRRVYVCMCGSVFLCLSLSVHSCVCLARVGINLPALEGKMYVYMSVSLSVSLSPCVHRSACG